MYQKYKHNKSKWHTLKQELLIMQVLKFGKMSLMMQDQIFGHLDVSFIKCVLFIHHFRAKILKVFTRKSRKENIQKFLINIRLNFLTLSTVVFIKILSKDRQPKNLSSIDLVLWIKSVMNMVFQSEEIVLLIFWKPFSLEERNSNWSQIFLFLDIKEV